MRSLNTATTIPAQPDSCDALAHTANRLADALERAEYIERIPALQLPWGRARHPALTAYMNAKLAALPSGVATPIDPSADDRIKLARLTGGLRRAVDLWARIESRKPDVISLKRTPREVDFFLDQENDSPATINHVKAASRPKRKAPTIASGAALRTSQRRAG